MTYIPDPAGLWLTANRLTSGEEIIDRTSLSNVGVTINSGTLRLTYFTCRRSATSTQGRMISGNTAAGATPTLCRWGLYAIDTAGDATLAASIPNDTTLFAAANTAYTRSWSTPITTIPGQRYAWGAIVVSGTTVPSYIGGASSGAGFGLAAASAPRLTGFVGSQTDLPASFAAGSVAAGANMIYAEILP